MTINDIARELADEYKRLLQNKNKIATGTLYNFTYEAEFRDGHFLVYFNLPNYWKYVEEGRKAGKMPPIESIKQWIQVKPLIPQPDKYGKIPTNDQLAYLVARKIGRDGIPATHSLQEAIYNNEPLIDDFLSEFTGAIYKDIFDELDK